MTDSRQSDTEFVLDALRAELADRPRGGVRWSDLARRLGWWLDGELEDRLGVALAELLGAGRVEQIIPEGFGGAFVYLRPTDAG